jgi:hypothetical protein
VGLADAAHAPISLVSLLEKTMEKGEVDRVYVTLVCLKVIALVKDLSDVETISGCFEKFIIGKQWSFPRSHISENHPSGFFTGIRPMTDIVPMFAAAGLSGLLQTAPFNIVKPTMVKAPESANFNSPVAKICSSVGTMNSQKPRAALVVAE